MSHQPAPFAARVIAALHLPDPVTEPGRSMAWLEDYVLTNAGIFAEAGIPAIKLQDQTRMPGPASIATVATMSALGRLIRKEYPAIALGTILQAHDGEAPFAVAKAAGAHFVRLKVFVGSVNGAEGPKHGLAVIARSYRQAIGADSVTILADVHDRTSIPVGGVSQQTAAQWAVQMGADSLVITGSSFDDSMSRIRAIKAGGIDKPILLGGGATADNVAASLGVADGVVVSTALMLKNRTPDSVLAWDRELCRRFMDEVRRAAA